jgi:hypothetical protein
MWGVVGACLMNPPPNEIRQRLIALHNDLGQSNGADCLEPLLKLLEDHGLTWGDWPELFCSWGLKSTTASKSVCRTIRGIHAQMGRGSTVATQRTARNHLIRKLAEESLSWTTDLPGVLGVEWDEAHPGGSNAASTSMSEPSETPPLFDIMVTVISDRVELMPAQCTVAALRQISTHVYDQFSHAPQIGIVAAASGCGKSTLRKTLEATAAIPWHSHNASPADICRVIDRTPRTSIFIEEAENLDWSRGSLMRAIADACYECDGEIDRVDKEGNPYKFRIFCPFVWVLRGSRDDMPMAVQSRSFVMMMKKGKPRIRLPKNYLEDPDLVATRNQAEAFAAAVRSGAIRLNLDPPIPEELCRDPRLADICRPLISVADALGVDEKARADLIEFCADLPSADVGVQALEDIEKVFASRHEHLFTLSAWTRGSSSPRKEPETPAFDRITKRALIAGMIEQDPLWSHWRGPNDKGAPHSLTPGELSGVLSRFGIFVKTIWPLRRRTGDRSVDGYYLSQFEPVWAEYCAEDHTSTQANGIIRLPRR